MPGLALAAPRDGRRLEELFREALDVEDGPTVVRFPKGELPEDLPAVGTLADGVDVLRYADAAEDGVSVLLVSIGALAGEALAAAEALADQGAGVTVVDPRWVSPIPGSLVGLAGDHDLVVTVEDGVIRGGIGAQLSEVLAAAEVDTPVRHLAFPDVFPAHSSRGELLSEVGLDAAGMTASIEGWLAALYPEAD